MSIHSVPQALWYWPTPRHRLSHAFYPVPNHDDMSYCGIELTGQARPDYRSADTSGRCRRCLKALDQPTHVTITPTPYRRTTTMSRLTKAQLEEQLTAAQAALAEKETVIETVRQKVLNYDGCYPGKRDFLTECGIDPKGPVPKADYVEVTFKIAVDRSSGFWVDADPETGVADFVESLLDDVENAWVGTGIEGEVPFQPSCCFVQSIAWSNTSGAARAYVEGRTITGP